MTAPPKNTQNSAYIECTCVTERIFVQAGLVMRTINETMLLSDVFVYNVLFVC